MFLRSARGDTIVIFLPLVFCHQKIGPGPGVIKETFRSGSGNQKVLRRSNTWDHLIFVALEKKSTILQCCVPVAGRDVYGPPGFGFGSVSQRFGFRSGSVSQRFGSESYSGSFYHQAKIVRKPLLPTNCFCCFFVTFHLWKRCNCTSQK